MNYAKQLPQDKSNNVYPAPPAFTSYQSQNGVPVSSSVLTLSQNTTVLQVMCIGGQAGNAGIIGKWGSGSVTGTNFDFMVNSGQVATFVVPVSVFGTQSGSLVGMNRAAGLYQTVALMAATAVSASVFTSEY